MIRANFVTKAAVRSNSMFYALFFNSFEADIGRFGMFDSTILLLVLSDIQQK